MVVPPFREKLRRERACPDGSRGDARLVRARDRNTTLEPEAPSNFPLTLN
jgi:hypothetical protein